MAGASGGVGRASRGSIAARARCVFWDGVSLLISVRAVDFLFKIKETLLIFSDLARMLARPGGTLEPLSLSELSAEETSPAHTPTSEASSPRPSAQLYAADHTVT